MYTFINAASHKTAEYICPDKNILYLDNSGDGTVWAPLLLHSYRDKSIRSGLSKVPPNKNIHLRILKNAETLKILYNLLNRRRSFPQPQIQNTIY